jgi:hypothetical protein
MVVAAATAMANIEIRLFLQVLIERGYQQDGGQSRILSGVANPDSLTGSLVGAERLTLRVRLTANLP